MKGGPQGCTRPGDVPGRCSGMPGDCKAGHWCYEQGEQGWCHDYH